MDTLVHYPPQNPGEFSIYEYYTLGLIPVRIIISKRVDGWCAYCLLKWMPLNYYSAYGDDINQPTSWERVRYNGDKIPEEYARDLFPEMEGPYAS